jgi:anthranilate phosphoribosyltransferase
MVVYGLEGLDEISIGGETMVGELKDGEVREYTIHPRQFGIAATALREIQVADAARSQDLLLKAVRNEQGAAREVVAVNAGAAIYVSGLADSLESGVEKARGVLASGGARRKLDELVEFSNRFKTVSQ